MQIIHEKLYLFKLNDLLALTEHYMFSYHKVPVDMKVTYLTIIPQARWIWDDR